MFEFIQSTMYKIKDSEKGMTALEMVIGVLIFVLLLAFMIDILVLFWKFSVLSQTTTQVARIAGLQGGVLNKAPEDWPARESYITINDLNGIVERKFDSASVDSNDWEMSIGHGGLRKTGQTSSTGEIDYKEEFTVETRLDYEWTYMSKVIPGMNLVQEIRAKRPAMSEWKYDYNSWEGE